MVSTSNYSEQKVCLTFKKSLKSGWHELEVYSVCKSFHMLPQILNVDPQFFRFKKNYHFPFHKSASSISKALFFTFFPLSLISVYAH